VVKLALETPECQRLLQCVSECLLDIFGWFTHGENMKVYTVIIIFPCAEALEKLHVASPLHGVSSRTATPINRRR
jgi:hypothetical protein